MLKTVFMGTPDFAATVLDALVTSGMAPQAVVCQPARATGRGLKVVSSEVEESAQRFRIPTLAVENVNKPDVVDWLAGHSPDLILVAAFGQLLKKEILEMPKIFCLNVHASLLPKYRGAAPIQRAVLDGQSTTGITIQKMVRKLDAGDILLRKSTPIGERENAAQLFHRLAVLGGQCLVEAVRLVESGKFTLEPQDETQASHAPKLTRDEAPIDWNRPAELILRQIRGLQPWPIAESRLGGERLKVFEAEEAAVHADTEPGTVFTDAKSYLHVACGHSSAVSLTQIQLENRKKLKTRDFLMAYRGSFPFKKMG